VAIEQGLTVLNWYENLSKDEVPPEHLWEDPEGLDEWWEQVEAKRDDGTATRGRYDDDGDDSSDSEAPGMAQNDLARSLKR
jgi:hypothetical protein